jgi:hypothetical protein
MSCKVSASGTWASAAAVVREIDAMGISNGSVGYTTVTINGGPTTTIMACGFIPQPASGEPPWGQLHQAMVTAIKANVPSTSPVDRVGTALRTGFNIGIYKSYQTVIQVDDARTGQAVQVSTTRQW